MKIRNYDHYLIILTVLILFATGVLSLYGIAYYNYLAVDTGWTKTAQYSQYIEEMDSYLYPLLILLLIALGLCIPKRLFEQDLLVKFSGIILGLTIILAIFLDTVTGLGFLLLVMTIVQGVVLLLTIKKSKNIRFEKEGDPAKLGSSLLHLGFVVIIFNFVSLRESQFHLTIFWGGMILVTIGNIFSFYPEKISLALK